MEEEEEEQEGRDVAYTTDFFKESASWSSTPSLPPSLPRSL